MGSAGDFLVILVGVVTREALTRNGKRIHSSFITLKTSDV